MVVVVVVVWALNMDLFYQQAGWKVNPKPHWGLNGPSPGLYPRPDLTYNAPSPS